jgi:hypothetical protein
MVTYTRSRNAVFFTVDKTLRRFKLSAAQKHVELYGMAPPVPVETGEQEVIEPVAKYIARLCNERKAVPIMLDTAPYLEAQQLSAGQYEAVIDELKDILGDFGIKDVRHYTCAHAPTEIPIVDPSSFAKTRYEYRPNCECRFPNNGLIRRACSENGIRSAVDKFGKFAVFAPSVMIGSNQDEREASIMKCNMSFIWAEAIIDGSIDWESQIDHTHLKAAREIQKEAKRLGNSIGSKIEISRAAQDMLPTN